MIIIYGLFLEINIRDYRAWYGLGQIYELVKLPNYALFYFAHARELRPRDSRMLLALGEMFERTDRNFEALTCYYKALYYDTDGTVLLKLGKYVKYLFSILHYTIFLKITIYYIMHVCMYSIIQKILFFFSF